MAKTRAARAIAVVLSLALTHVAFAPQVWATSFAPGAAGGDAAKHPTAPPRTPTVGSEERPGRTPDDLTHLVSAPLSPAAPDGASTAHDASPPPSHDSLTRETIGTLPSPPTAVSAAASNVAAPPGQEIRPVEEPRVFPLELRTFHGDRSSPFSPRASHILGLVVRIGQSLLRNSRTPETTLRADDLLIENVGSPTVRGTLPAATARSKTPSTEIPPAPTPQLPAGRGLPLVLGAMLLNIILTYPGIEALGVVVPQIAQQMGTWMLAVLATAAPLALSVGSLFGGWAVGRYGAERTYLAAMGLRAAAVGAMGARYASGTLTSASLIGFFSGDYALHFMNGVALDTLAAERLEGDKSRLIRFNLIQRALVQFIGFVGCIGAGVVSAATKSYQVIFQSYPLMFLAATAVGALAFSIHGKSEARAPEAGPVGSWRESIAEIRGSPILLGVLATTVLANVVNLAIYLSIAPVFSAATLAVVGGSTALHASVLAGLFAGGGLFGLSAAAWLTRDESVDLPRLLGKTAVLAGLSLLSFWSLLWLAPIAHLTLWGVAVPLFAAQLLMILPGAMMEMMSIGTNIVQTTASRRTLAKTLALNRFVAMAACVLFANTAVPMLNFHAPLAGFIGLGLVMTAFAALTVAVGLNLQRAAP